MNSPRARVPAVDRPLFWWTAATVFLVNAGLSAGEERWPVALLQVLTALWAAVAGVSAAERGAGSAVDGPGGHADDRGWSQQ
ncbi:hypothetical protein [Blastococcus sp. VKM Ac-2987]|uniref:hypothetical protein n=1 Tax=Blastococcus sp. VKM Ac-2987 TaxID=3004141 RepID=UPI0022AB55E6|nr:hypothetical protein [Blastococcus sp. VKM Ac-2987]MCZ2860686.1 hypothetical protein [Blastococcus sp. VKM Ac-2987]